MMYIVIESKLPAIFYSEAETLPWAFEQLTSLFIIKHWPLQVIYELRCDGKVNTNIRSIDIGCFKLMVDVYRKSPHYFFFTQKGAMKWLLKNKFEWFL